jgi:hypothetical protein
MQIAMMTVKHCAIAIAIAACTRPDGRAVMDDSTFVATMARLQVIERKTDVSEAVRDSLRRAVLQEQGLTAADLERQARSYADDPAHASAIWTAISRKTTPLDTSATRGGANP